MAPAVSSVGDPAGLPDLTGDQARRLLDAVVGVASDLSLPDVLRRIVDSATRLAGARYGALGVLDEGGGELSEFIVSGLDAEAQRRIGDHPTGKGVLGLLIAQPEPVRLPDIRLHPNSYGFPPNHPPMHSFLGVPVRVGGAVFGNLYLAEKVDAAEFTGGDEQVVVALAAAAGVAVREGPPVPRQQAARAVAGGGERHHPGAAGGAGPGRGARPDRAAGPGGHRRRAARSWPCPPVTVRPG